MPEDLAAASDALDTLLTKGLRVAHDVIETLTAKRPPPYEDLAALTRTRKAFDAVVASLTAAGAHVAEETMAAVFEAAPTGHGAGRRRESSSAA